MRRPSGSVGVALLALFQIVVSMTTGPSTINRHSQGDIFSHQGASGECNAAACLSALGHRNNGSLSTARLGRYCQCQCPIERPIYREDLKQCVSTIDECALADYVSGIQSEKVPFVFLPVQGQLINPNAEIALSDVRAEGQVVVSPVCVVSKAHYLTRSGWMATDNSSAGISSDIELPFALARESGRTHLQWLGEPRLRLLMEGRIVLVKLLCKDTANARIGVFSPCIAFRVAGSPGLVEAVRSGASASGEEKSGLRHADYVAIGISSALLGMLYVAGLVGFICYRRRKRQLENVHIKLAAQPGTPVQELAMMRHNPLHQSNRNRQATGDPSHNLRSSHRSSSHRSSSAREDNNRRHASGNLHPAMNNYRFSGGADDRLRDSSMDNGRCDGYFYQGRDSPMITNERRLFFSPSYFDPELLKSPPPAAVEFLARIRGMIDVAKDKMSSKRFMPSLIDIPEELSHYSAYGSNQRLSHYAEELRRSGSFNQTPFTVASVDETDHHNGRHPGYGTLKRPLKKSSDVALQQQQQSAANRKTPADDNAEGVKTSEAAMDDLYHAVELRTNFLQKSPLPGRKLGADTALNHASIYTNPSIEEIYKSLDRSLHERPRLKTNESGADSDAVSDLVSEAESKMPKITGPDGVVINRQTYFEPDSLDRKPNQPAINTHSSSSRPHLYQKKPPRWTKRPAAQHPDTNDEMREADEQSSSAAGYNSSTCTSIQSLSRVLPAEEAMEVGNQLFNMDTGAPTLPRHVVKSDHNHFYETIQRPADGFLVKKELYAARNRRPDVSDANSSHSSSSSSKVTVVGDGLPGTLTIQVEDVGGGRQRDEIDGFEPDTLERRNNETEPFRRQDSFIADSLERPIQPVKTTIHKLMHPRQQTPSSISPSSSSGLGSSGESVTNKDEWIKKEELPPPGSVVSLRQIYTARHGQPDVWSSGPAAVAAKKPPVHRPVSAANTQVILRLTAQDEARDFQSLPSETISAAPPLPSKSNVGPAPLIPRDLKPAPIGAHQHPVATSSSSSVTKSNSVWHSRGVQTETSAVVTPPPTLPPKNGKGGSIGRAGAAAAAATSAESGLGVADKIYSGHFILSHPSPGGTIKLPNVLERIAQIEREESRISGTSKGMEIALALKARMGHLEGSLKDHKKTLSIKKTWRKLLDKVEDSFSETESTGSTLRRARSSKVVKKSLPPPPPSDDEDDGSDDDRSRSSLGSDGTGRDRHSLAGGATESPAVAEGVKLKSFYTFGEDQSSTGVVQPTPPAVKSAAAAAAAGGRRSINPPPANHAGRKLRTSDSYDSGLYSTSNYSTYIGDY